MYGIFLWKSQNPGSCRTLGTNWQSLHSHQDHHPRSWRMSSRPAQLSLHHSGQNTDQGERSGPWVWARPEDRGAPWDAVLIYFLFYFVFVVILLFISYWSIIAVQCCPTGISCKYTYIPSLLSLPPRSIPPLWVITEHKLSSLWYTKASHWLAILSMVFVYLAMLLSQFIPPSPPAPLHVCSVPVTLSCPANRFICTIFLDSICMC